MDIKDTILVTKATLPPFEEYVNEIRSIWDNHWLTNMGEKHNELQHKLEKYLKVPHVNLMVNGHMALEMTLQAFELKGEVITTPFTFVSTTHAIFRNGLTPVFCDIKKDDYTIDPDLIEGLITEKTSAIVPVHVYGNVCDVDKIDKIAKKHNLKVIYDAAHAFGESYKGIGIGNFGDASIFSFHATKVFNTIEGGCVTYNDTYIGDRLYNLKNFGIKNEESVIAVGANAKMNEFQASMGLCNLVHIEENIQKRRTIFELYNALLKEIKGIQVLIPNDFTISNYAYYPILIDSDVYGMTRDDLYNILIGHNIRSRKYFYPLTSDLEVYKDNTDSINNTPIANEVANSVLTLPLYPDLSKEVVQYICEIIETKGQ